MTLRATSKTTPLMRVTSLPVELSLLPAQAARCLSRGSLARSVPSAAVELVPALGRGSLAFSAQGQETPSQSSGARQPARRLALPRPSLAILGLRVRGPFLEARRHQLLVLLLGSSMLL